LKRALKRHLPDVVILGWLMHDEHTATPEPLTGTVIWSNDDTRRIVVKVDGRDDGTREYPVAAQQWTGPDGTTHTRGYPSCLAGHAGDPVRTDLRRVAIEVVHLNLDENQTQPLVVTVTCFD
jgi:hypothetical protein